MPTTRQTRGGRTAWNNSFIGAPRQVTVDTERNTLRVHDGSTPGGHELRSPDDIDPREFGARFDGVADDTVALQAAIDRAAATGQRLVLPAGTAMVGRLFLRPHLHMVGAGPVQTTLKCLRSVSSGTWIDCEIQCNDLILKEFGIDGDRQAGDPIGADALRVFSSRPTLDNITIINARGWGLKTIHTLSDRTYSILGTFRRITIDRTGGGGWEHEGPNDSYGSSIEIVDVSQAEDLGYPGFRTVNYGTISIHNIHIWNRTTGQAVNRPSSAVQLDAGGQKFVNSMFESGGNAVVFCNHGYNMFENCAVFAPDGGVALVLVAGWNRFTGMVGGNKDFLYQDYVGLAFYSASQGNVVDVIDAGCTLGSVDWTHSGGNNSIRVRGHKAAGEANWVGYPRKSDDCDIRTDGPGGATLIKPIEIPWHEQAVGVSPGSGSFADASASTRYHILGSVVHFDATITVNAAGSAAGAITIPIPIPAKRLSSLSAVDSNLRVLSALLNSGTGLVAITTATGDFAGADGLVIFVSGSYEAGG